MCNSNSTKYQNGTLNTSTTSVLKHLLNPSKRKLKVTNTLLLTFCIGGDLIKLRGLYYLTSRRYVIPMDVFDHGKTGPQHHHMKNQITIVRQSKRNNNTNDSNNEIQMEETGRQDELE